MRIYELTETKSTRWDAYVCNSEDGVPHHLSGWQRVMAKTYGYDTIYLMATQNSPVDASGVQLNGANSAKDDGRDKPANQERVVGVLPLFVVRSPLLGHTVTSMPGGLCADDAESALALLAQAKSRAIELGSDRLTLHDSRQAWPDDEMQTSSGHEQWLVDLRPGVDDLWQDLDRNIRRQVRIARRNNLHATVDRRGDFVDEFYDLFSQFAHSAGTPIFPRSFVHNIVATFPNGFNIVRVSLDGKTIGSYFQLELGHTNYGVWGATLHEYLDLRPVYLAYWTIMEDSVDQDFRWLDMGRSPADSNASKYKGQWGGKSAPVFQQTYGVGEQAQGVSVADQTQSDAKFRLVRKMWPKLPFRVAQFLGPQIRRHVPFA